MTLNITNLIAFFNFFGWEVELNHVYPQKTKTGESFVFFDIKARKEESLGPVEFYERCCLKKDKIAYMLCRLVTRTIEDWGKERSDQYEEQYYAYRFELLNRFLEAFDVDEEVKESIEWRIQEAWDKNHG